MYLKELKSFWTERRKELGHSCGEWQEKDSSSMKAAAHQETRVPNIVYTMVTEYGYVTIGTDSATYSKYFSKYWFAEKQYTLSVCMK